MQCVEWWSDAKRALRRAGYFCGVAREESSGDCAELEAGRF